MENLSTEDNIKTLNDHSYSTSLKGIEALRSMNDDLVGQINTLQQEKDLFLQFNFTSLISHPKADDKINFYTEFPNACSLITFYAFLNVSIVCGIVFDRYVAEWIELWYLEAMTSCNWEIRVPGPVGASKLEFFHPGFIPTVYL